MTDSGFSVNEVCAAAEATRDRLNYIEKKGLVIPQRLSLPGRKQPIVIYQYSDLVAVRVLQDLKSSDYSDRVLKRVCDFIGEHCVPGFFKEKRIWLINGSPEILSKDCTMNSLLGKLHWGPGKVYTIYPFCDVDTRMIDLVEKSRKKIDHEDFKARVLFTEPEPELAIA